jgi:hypothetical protein
MTAAGIDVRHDVILAGAPGTTARSSFATRVPIRRRGAADDRPTVCRVRLLQQAVDRPTGRQPWTRTALPRGAAARPCLRVRCGLSVPRRKRRNENRTPKGSNEAAARSLARMCARAA